MQRVSFYIIQTLEGNRVKSLIPRVYRFEDAKAYCKAASRLGQRLAMTRVEVVFHIQGKPPKDRIEARIAG